MNVALFRFMAGFRRFREKYFEENLEHSVYRKLATGQTPKTLLIGCSDSRVDPAILSGAAPGDMFVIRNVASLIPPCEQSTSLHGTSSALEFAVVNLKVENIIILGHRQCGGINALMNEALSAKTTFIGKWISIAKEAKEVVNREHPDADYETKWRLAEMEALKVSLKNLHSFPFVQEAIKSRQMTVTVVYFDLEQGQLWEYDQAANQFKQLAI